MDIVFLMVQINFPKKISKEGFQKDFQNYFVFQPASKYFKPVKNNIVRA